MSVYFVTGGLGSGKGLAAIGQIKNYSENGLKIAGNIDVFLEHLSSDKNSKITYIRVPDRPTAADLIALGSGNDTYDPLNNSLLVLDELATWFNARTWNERGRSSLIDWLVHSRKHGWDVILIAQSITALDRQLVDLLMEYHVPMTDFSKINVPIIGKLLKHYTRRGRPLKLPKIHLGNVLYKDKVKADTWIFRARELYQAYDTKQVFTDSYPHGSHSVLSNWHLTGRYEILKNYRLLYLKIPFYFLLKFAFFVTRNKNFRLLTTKY